jgi:hypothetical protein
MIFYEVAARYCQYRILPLDMLHCILTIVKVRKLLNLVPRLNFMSSYVSNQMTAIHNHWSTTDAYPKTRFEYNAAERDLNSSPSF